jgi:hypothetical protein
MKSGSLLSIRALCLVPSLGGGRREAGRTLPLLLSPACDTLRAFELTLARDEIRAPSRPMNSPSQCAMSGSGQACQRRFRVGDPAREYGRCPARTGDLLLVRRGRLLPSTAVCRSYTRRATNRAGLRGLLPFAASTALPHKCSSGTGARRTQGPCQLAGRAGVRPWRRMTSATLARSGGPPGFDASTSWISRK